MINKVTALLESEDFSFKRLLKMSVKQGGGDSNSGRKKQKTINRRSTIITLLAALVFAGVTVFSKYG